MIRSSSILATHRNLYSTKRVYSTILGDWEHPLIDVSPLLESVYENNHSSRAATAQTERRSDAISNIGRALREKGYFYAQNVSVLPLNYLNFIYEYSRHLHSLPLHVKNKFAQRGGYGAYSGMDIGQPELAYDPSTVASVHAWDYSRNSFSLSQSSPLPNKGNSFPDAADGITPPYHQVLDGLYERQNILARALMGAFAEALELPPNTFVNMFDGHSSDPQDDVGDFGTIRLLHYPGIATTSTAEEAANLQKANIGISAHTDFEAFTLMHQSAPGLQFLIPNHDPVNNTRERRWVDAPASAEEFVVIIGDALERCTNGFWKATPHRVLKTAHPRWSIIRFNAFAPNTVVRPLEKFVSPENPASYTPVTMKVHMQTTMKNLEAGLGAWDDVTQTSRTANYVYIDGKDP
jgi:isopenicillin N synthase-like dioxygenase